MTELYKRVSRHVTASIGFEILLEIDGQILEHILFGNLESSSLREADMARHDPYISLERNMG